MASTRRRARRLALRWGDLGRAVVALVGFALGLLVASWIVPDFNVGGAGRALVAAVLIFAPAFEHFGAGSFHPTVGASVDAYLEQHAVDWKP